MKIKLLSLLTIYILISQCVIAQTDNSLFSRIDFIVQNKNDSAFLINIEAQMYNAAQKGGIRVYDNAAFDIGFNVTLSKAAINIWLKDSFLSPSKVTSKYRMILMENRYVDTCYIMSLSPMLINYHKLYHSFGPMVRDTTVHALIKLCDYPSFLPQKDMQRLHNYSINQLSNQLGGERSGDTIHRMVLFTCDSNEYLPQAPYANLIAHLQNTLFAGKLRAYSAKNLKTPLSKYAMEALCAGWDSTNQVEDPNNPGVFISAPIKHVGRPKSFLIYERWIPFTPQIGSENFPYSPTPYIGYRREVLAYGLLLTNGNELWLSSTDADKVLQQDKFNMIPYEECFRAERFKTLQIQVHTW